MQQKWRSSNWYKLVRYLISFEYLGSKFFGSQVQKQEPTVQGELIKAICTLTKNKNTKVIMSGRTDRGVSAYYQTAHFDTEIEVKDKNKFLISLNSILPDGVRVFDIENIVASFHAQKSAKYRHYRYKINNSLAKSVFDLNVYHTRMKLDVERMQKALEYILGEHDFSAFRSVSDNPARICTIYKASVRSDSEYILIDIVGNRFLYNMVRAIVGTLFYIESKNLDSTHMKDVLDSKKRELAGANADPIGLTLVKVGYDDPILYVSKLNERQTHNENL